MPNKQIFLGQQIGLERILTSFVNTLTSAPDF